MSLAILYSRSRLGVNAPLITVEVHLSNGLPSLTIVGMPEVAVKESKDRVRSAILNSEFEFPSRRITVNLAPADLPKQGGQFDLPIALGILAASGQIPSDKLNRFEFLGELALNGELRPIRGALPAAIACGDQDRILICPQANAVEAALCKTTPVQSASSLLSVCAHLCGQTELPITEHSPESPVRKVHLDISDVKGQLQAKRALEIAAAGEHHLLLYGPPGTGKSMLAQRLPGILPPLNQRAMLEVASVLSVSSSTPLEGLPQRPFAAPHHTASAVSLVGGGTQPRPGEISLAHRGVLFLDELPEFQRQVLEVLREPLETGEIRISRATAQVEFPARFQLIAAMNPCPCGYQGSTDNRCQCTPDQVRRYRNKISGPLLDRIDMHVPVTALKQGELRHGDTGESSQDVQARVLDARKRQRARGQQAPNGQLQSTDIEQFCQLDDKQWQFLEQATQRLGMSARATHRVIKVARTIADLAGEEGIQQAHLTEALSYRTLDRAIR